MAIVGYSIVAIFYAAILLFLELRRESRPAQILRFAPLRLVGRYSYFLYLFQGLVVYLVVGLVFNRQFSLTQPANWAQFGVGLAALVGAAAISWRFFESPILALGHRFSYRPDMPSVPLNHSS